MLKRLAACLIIAVAFQFSYGVMLGLTQENKEIQEIKKVIETYRKSLAEGDIASAIKQVAHDCYIWTKGEFLKYEELETGLKKFVDSLSRKYKDVSVIGVDVIKSSFEGNKVFLEVIVKTKGFDLTAKKQYISERKIYFSLVKNDGLWKIQRMIPMAEAKFL